MRVAQVPYSAGPNEVLVRMTTGEARDLRDQVLVLWRSLFLTRERPQEGTPLARLYAELDRTLGEQRTG